MRAARANCSGFSLAELLTVLAIIGVMVTLSVPALKGVTESTSMTQALTRIGGTMDVARNYAVANNTHTWVAFTENAQSGDSQVKVAAFASKTGINLNTGEESGESVTVEFPSAKVEMISPIETIRQVRVDGVIPENNALRSSGGMPQAAEIVELPMSGAGLQFLVAETAFTRSIHFRPSGEASVDLVIPEVIQLVVSPEKALGVRSEKDDRQATVIRVSGLTGQAVVYQPR